MLKSVSRTEVEKAVDYAIGQRMGELRNDFNKVISAGQSQLADMLKRAEQAVESVERREKVLEKDMEELKRLMAEYTERIEDVEREVGM